MDMTPVTPSPSPKSRMLVLPRHMQLAMREGVPEWDKASYRARVVATHRLVIVGYIKEYTDCGVTQNRAIASLIESFDSDGLSVSIRNAMVGTAKKGRARPSDKTIAQWCKDFKDAGYDRVGLLPGHIGRANPPKDWWPLATDFYNQPSKPSYAAVCRWLGGEPGI